MTEDEVYQRLKEFNAQMGRYKHMRYMCERLEREIVAARRERLLTMASPKAQVITDMPKGGSAAHSAIEDAVIACEGDSAEINELRDKLIECSHEARNAKSNTDVVELWLECLPEREVFVLRAHIMDARAWYAVVDEYGRKYEEVSVGTLKAIQRRALFTIYKMVR